jgi:hypothetical protein
MSVKKAQPTFEAAYQLMSVVGEWYANDECLKGVGAKYAKAKSAVALAEEAVGAVKEAKRVAELAVHGCHALDPRCSDNAGSVSFLMDEAIKTAEALLADATSVLETTDAAQAVLLKVDVRKLMEIRVASYAAGIEMVPAYRIYRAEFAKAAVGVPLFAIASVAARTAVAAGDDSVVDDSMLEYEALDAEKAVVETGVVEKEDAETADADAEKAAEDVETETEEDEGTAEVPRKRFRSD